MQSEWPPVNTRAPTTDVRGFRLLTPLSSVAESTQDGMPQYSVGDGDGMISNFMSVPLSNASEAPWALRVKTTLSQSVSAKNIRKISTIHREIHRETP